MERPWPAPVQSLLVQQIAEPKEEQELREGILRLTPIESAVSVSVQRQYEENPYPRWVTLASDRGRVDLNQCLHQLLPAASFRELASTGSIDILVAGCGTGQQAIATARRFAGARVLAVDLSLASLCYAKRMSRKLAVDNVDYAQADLLELASLPRTFDLIEASGVLHHLADPMAGWSVLLKLLRPGGFMHIGLYSRTARGQIRAARAFFAEKGVVASPEGIRRSRGELLSTAMRSVADYADFFTTSECRDLLFHVQEHQLSIPEIDTFLREHDLAFIGFELPPQAIANYRFRFPEDRRMANLACWDVFERENPTTFASMYQFWVQQS
jgi:SAM-dependent methyltransferase